MKEETAKKKENKEAKKKYNEDVDRENNMLDGNPLIAEIHQADPMMNVYVVVGKTEEAVACMNMFNKNIAEYLTYNFPIKEVGKEFIKRLLRFSVKPELIKDIGNCTWDKKTRVLTTPKDIEDAEKKKL